MKNILTIALLLPLWGFAQKNYELSSPDGLIRVNLQVGAALYYSVSFDNKLILEPSQIDMELTDGKKLSGDLRSGKPVLRKINDVIVSPVPEKRKLIPDQYQSLLLRFRSGFSVEFRAYNDGVAYRLHSHFKDSIKIRGEIARFKFHRSHPTYYTEVVFRDNADRYHTSFEELYTQKPLDSIGTEALIFSPTLVAMNEGPRVLLTESDLESYPGMFLTGTESAMLEGHFAAYPLEEKLTEGEFPQAIVTRRADYIAHTRGERTYPWRVMLIAGSDRELPANDLVYRLASPSRVKDPSWIQPGKGTDEWIIGINLFNVPFKTGINTATYKYYIDFAKRFGFERIMMDAGWCDYKDLFKINPALDMEEIAAYARKQNIRLSMWTLAHTLDRQLEPALEQFKKWGVDFIMTDFMDRDDQKMVDFYHRIAEACARHQIMVMYHGAFKTAGFNRTWPHAVTREGVLGSEYNIWSTKADPEHNLLLPFIRMAAGPMDYEPGLLDNATPKTFRPISEKVMSLGTRCHQAAMFVVYESPIQLFSGNPSQGLLEPQFMELIGSIPTVWDTTIVLDGRIGDHISIARKKGNEWFIGAMTDWTERELRFSLDFLPPGNWKAKILRDGVNADRYPSDYVMEEKQVKKGDVLTIRLAPGGGAVVKLY